MQIIFLSGTKCLWLPKYVNKFLVCHKKFGPAQNILGPVKGQGIREYVPEPCAHKRIEKMEMYILPKSRKTKSIQQWKFHYKCLHQSYFPGGLCHFLAAPKPWLDFSTFLGHQKINLTSNRCLRSMSSFGSLTSRAPECQKSWWGQAYVAGIICSLPTLSKNELLCQLFGELG